MDEMTSPTRIFNCFNGHICEGCKQKLKQPVYPKCRTNIIGRATNIENYLTICTFSQMFVPILSISIYIYIYMYSIASSATLSARDSILVEAVALAEVQDLVLLWGRQS